MNMDMDIIREYIMENTGMSELICPELYEDSSSVYMRICSRNLFINDIEWQHLMYVTYIATVVLKIEKPLRVMEHVLFAGVHTPSCSTEYRVINFGEFQFLTFDFKEYIMDRDTITEVQFKQRCIEVCSKWYKEPTTMALLLEEFKQDNVEDIEL